MGVFNRNDDDTLSVEKLIKTLERASFEERERIRVLLDAVAVVERKESERSGRDKVLVLVKE